MSTGAGPIQLSILVGNRPFRIVKLPFWFSISRWFEQMGIQSLRP